MQLLELSNQIDGTRYMEGDPWIYIQGSSDIIIQEIGEVSFIRILRPVPSSLDGWDPEPDRGGYGIEWRRLRRSLSRTISSRASSSACRRTTLRGSSGPPRSTRPGAASSPTPPSTAATARCTQRPPCSASSTALGTPSFPASSPPRPSARPPPTIASTRSTAAVPPRPRHLLRLRLPRRLRRLGPGHRRAAPSPR